MHPVTVFIERFRAAVSVLIGPCCPALLNRIHKFNTESLSASRLASLPGKCQPRLRNRRSSDITNFTGNPRHFDIAWLVT